MRKLFILAITVFSFFSPGMAAAQVRGGTFIIGIPDNPDHLDGHRMQSAVGYWLSSGTYDPGLVSGRINTM